MDDVDVSPNEMARRWGKAHRGFSASHVFMCMVPIRTGHSDARQHGESPSERKSDGTHDDCVLSESKKAKSGGPIWSRDL